MMRQWLGLGLVQLATRGREHLTDAHAHFNLKAGEDEEAEGGGGGAEADVRRHGVVRKVPRRV